AGALLLLGDTQLLRHQVVVDGPLDVAEDADRRAAVRSLGHAREGERERRRLVLRVVDEDVLVAGRARLDRAVRPLAERLLAVLAPRDRLAAPQRDPVDAFLVVADELPGVVVEDR